MCRRDFPAACRWRSSSIYHSKAESNTFEETGRSKPQRVLYKAESEIPVRPCLCKLNNYSPNFISPQCVAITTNLSWRRKRLLSSEAVGLYRLFYCGAFPFSNMNKLDVRCTKILRLLEASFVSQREALSTSTDMLNSPFKSFLLVTVSVLIKLCSAVSCAKLKMGLCFV